MARRDLQMEILRKNRRVAEIDLREDPNAAGALTAALRSWLEGNGWDEKLWPQFSANVRAAGEFRVLAKVRS